MGLPTPENRALFCLVPAFLMVWGLALRTERQMDGLNPVGAVGADDVGLHFTLSLYPFI